MHRHTPGPSAVLLISKMMHFDVDQIFSPVPICHIKMYILLYVHCYISVIRLVEIRRYIDIPLLVTKGYPVSMPNSPTQFGKN